MVGWHHRLGGHEFEQAVGVGDGQGGLACCSPQRCRVRHTEQLNNNNSNILQTSTLESFSCEGHLVVRGLQRLFLRAPIWPSWHFPFCVWD